MTDLSAPAGHDIFTDNHAWGDVDSWNRAALDLHEHGGIHRIERDGFEPFWAVIDHAADRPSQSSKSSAASATSRSTSRCRSHSR